MKVNITTRILYRRHFESEVAYENAVFTYIKANNADIIHREWGYNGKDDNAFTVLLEREYYGLY